MKIEGIGVQVAIAKVWRLCRRYMDRDDQAKGVEGDAALEDPIAVPTKKQLSLVWTQRHNFEWTGECLLVEGLQGRLYQEIQASPNFLAYTCWNSCGFYLPLTRSLF